MLGPCTYVIGWGFRVFFERIKKYKIQNDSFVSSLKNKPLGKRDILHQMVTEI